MERSKVYEAIDSECAYQDQSLHNIWAWIRRMREHLNAAGVVYYKKDGDKRALIELRKALALGVACAEQHGLPKREG